MTILYCFLSILGIFGMIGIAGYFIESWYYRDDDNDNDEMHI